MSSEPDTGFARSLRHVYLALAAIATLYITASVVKALWFSGPRAALVEARLQTPKPDSKALLRCNDDVDALLQKLGTTSGQLIAEPTRNPLPKGSVLAARWDAFSRDWLNRWELTDLRCRFSELEGMRLGVAYDRMARVHGDLLAMRLRYESLIRHFDDEQADELADMRRALDASRITLAKQTHAR